MKANPEVAQEYQQNLNAMKETPRDQWTEKQEAMFEKSQTIIENFHSSHGGKQTQAIDDFQALTGARR